MCRLGGSEPSVVSKIQDAGRANLILASTRRYFRHDCQELILLSSDSLSAVSVRLIVSRIASNHEAAPRVSAIGQTMRLGASAIRRSGP